jgi:hypothetical protein
LAGDLVYRRKSLLISENDRCLKKVAEEVHNLTLNSCVCSLLQTKDEQDLSILLKSRIFAEVIGEGGWIVR